MNRYERIEVRFRDNLRRLPEYREYIFSQSAAIVRDLSYGERGHIGTEGCGPVAIHNVMKFIGKTQNFCEVSREAEELRMTWLGARFGTKPHSLGRYFTRHKISYWKYNSPAEFKAKLLTHRIGIVCTWNPGMRGIHFYCIYYSYEENKYYTLNLMPAAEDFVSLPLVTIVNRRFITGYLLK